MNTSFLYNDFGSWMKQQFPFKVQKISIDAAFLVQIETEPLLVEAVLIVIIGRLIPLIVIKEILLRNN